MSKIEELIKKLCPNGVPKKKLGELGKFYSGLSGKNKFDFIDGNKKFITYMNIFKNLEVNLNGCEKVKIEPNEKQNKLEYGDIVFTGSSETLDEAGMTSVLTKKFEEDIYLNSFCFIFRFDDKNLFLPDFSKHLFRSTNLRKQIIKTANGVTRFNVSKKSMENIIIPIVPLEIQKEIVSFLDQFEVASEKLYDLLNEEQIGRKKQYEYYSKKLFELKEINYLPLEQIAEIGTGSSNTNEAVENGKYSFYVRSQQIYSKNDYEYDEIAIITAGDGVGVGKIFQYVDGKYALHQRAYRIKITDTKVIPKFFYYYMKTTFMEYIKKNVYNSSVLSIRRPMLNKYLVPIIPIKEQERIVNILDNFEKICNDLSSGLPAEIDARKKQYEYYRDKLMTF